jgi:hypothetical protein
MGSGLGGGGRGCAGACAVQHSAMTPAVSSAASDRPADFKPCRDTQLIFIFCAPSYD